jgi:hypothetical protein
VSEPLTYEQIRAVLYGADGRALGAGHVDALVKDLRDLLERFALYAWVTVHEAPQVYLASLDGAE